MLTAHLCSYEGAQYSALEVLLEAVEKAKVIFFRRFQVGAVCPPLPGSQQHRDSWLSCPRGMVSESLRYTFLKGTTQEDSVSPLLETEAAELLTETCFQSIPFHFLGTMSRL